MTDLVNEYKLDCYEKKAALGTKGTIWLVEEKVSGKRFVLRRLPMGAQKVYEILKGIHHSNIVEVEDVFCYGGFCYVIEEYLEWELLSQYIEGKRVSKHQVRSVAKQLLRALIVLHEHNIVHKDIKPENIMINSFGAVKLIDFDIAHLFSEEKTKDTTLKGSRDYAPPEQFGFSQSDCRTDIYALGVTLNELAVGELPEKRLCRGRMGAVIKRCIEFDPKRRFQTAKQVFWHIRRQERGAAAFFILSAMVFLIFIILKYLPIEHTASLEELSKVTEYQNRIISMRVRGECPSVLICDGETVEFTADLGDGRETEIFAGQTKDKLHISGTLDNGERFEYDFDDVFEEWYKELGYSINTDIELTSPEYEIVQCDFDEDGKKEIFIAFSWRRYIETSMPEMNYYLTEYSIVWMIYLNEEGVLVCSKPLGFEGCLPVLENGGIFYESLNTIWYKWDKKNAAWAEVY